MHAHVYILYAREYACSNAYAHTIRAKTNDLTMRTYIYKINASNAMPEPYLTVYIRKLWPEVTQVTVDGLTSTRIYRRVGRGFPRCPETPLLTIKGQG